MSSELHRKLEGKLIASCQATEGDPFRDSSLIATFAKAAVMGGAAAIRADSPGDIRAIRRELTVPILGLRKKKHTDGRMLITPTFEDAKALVDAGADIVALDCTARGQLTGAIERLRRIRSELKVPVAADIATVDEGCAAAAAGADFVLSTMRGYTQETSSVTGFEPGFIRELTGSIDKPVIAEGQIHAPEQARAAIDAGAFAVVVGTAISRPRNITGWFAKAVESEYAYVNGNPAFIGIDLGGTGTKYGLVRGRTGEVVFSSAAATPSGCGQEGLLLHLERVARTALEHGGALGIEPAGIGIATAGWVDTNRGTVVYATENLPGWTGTAIAERIGGAFDLPVAVENDANALALAEAHFGAGRGLRHFICITLGTGVGGGCFIDGRVNRGAHFFANAAGHITLYPGGLPCSCGKHGCLEPYANAAALLRYAQGRFSDPRHLIRAANDGDPLARHAVRELANNLAQGCASLVQLLDPEALIISGGLVQDNPLLIDDVRTCLGEFVSTWQLRGMKVVASDLGYHGGVLGAAAIAAERSRKSLGRSSAPAGARQ